jgi:zinc protease
VEIDKLREETIAKLHLRLEDDADLTRMKLFENLFAGHPYGRTQDGTLASLRSLTRADISDYFKTHLHHGGMLLGASGDITRERLNELARKLVGALPKGKATELVVPFTAKLKGLDVILVDKPERSQSHFFIAQPGIHARDKDYFPLNVFMTAFAGGLFQAQYMQEIRVKRGWAYGASGRSDARRDGGGIWLYTYPKTADTIAAIKLSLDLLEKAVNGDGLSDDAIEFSKKYLARSFPFLIDVPDKVISERIYQKIVGQGDDFLETYVSRIEAVTSAQARAAAKANLSSKNVRIVMLCTAKDFEKTIGKELGATSVKVVPYNRL